MGGATFIVVDDPIWRFDVDDVFAALRRAHLGKPLWQGSDPRQLRAEGWLDSWEVNLGQDGTAFIIKAPPAAHMEMVSWVRSYVPAEVTLTIFDDQLSFDATPLRPGITAEEIRAELFPDAWKVEQLSSPEPPTREERRRSSKPPHLP